MDKKAAVKEEHGYAVIRIPMEDIHGFRVALEECPCKAVKSIETQGIRIKLAKALGRLEARR